jgi:hypothetical protein
MLIALRSFTSLKMGVRMYRSGAMTLTDFIAVAGLVFGLTGSILGVLNYLRDRVKLDVTLQWDMDVRPGTPFDPHKKWGVIRVTNVGRRTAYISHDALRLPKRYDELLVIMDSVQGEKLAEGDPTKVYIVSQEGLEKYAGDWRKIVAQVNDSTGKIWNSKKLKNNAIPSWTVSVSKEV